MDNEEKVLEFDEIANSVFKPIYPVIASQIIEKTKTNYGECIDIGSCGGHLGIEIARLTNMFVNLLDISPFALKVADKRIEDEGFKDRMKTVLGDVQEIPFKSESVELVVSRGSIWFWENQVTALKEIYRVLKNGGSAYIGGGFGNAKLKKEVFEKMEAREKNWEGRRKGFIKDNSAEKFERLAKEAEIQSYEIIDNDSGLWLCINKISE